MSRRVDSSYCISNFFMESRESCLAADGRAWKVDGRAQALVGPGLATPLHVRHCQIHLDYCMCNHADVSL